MEEKKDNYEHRCQLLTVQLLQFKRKLRPLFPINIFSYSPVKCLVVFIEQKNEWLETIYAISTQWTIPKGQRS